MTASTEVSGKVAGILNERELTINIGSKDGVIVGMKFKILAESPLEVRDPENDELLGVVDREKVRVKASEVYDRFSVCRTYVTHTTEGFVPLNAARLLLEPPRTVVETLKADDRSFPPPLPEEESYVKRGDRVVSIGNSD